MIFAKFLYVGNAILRRGEDRRFEGDNGAPRQKDLEGAIADYNEADPAEPGL